MQARGIATLVAAGLLAYPGACARRSVTQVPAPVTASGPVAHDAAPSSMAPVEEAPKVPQKPSDGPPEMDAPSPREPPRHGRTVQVDPPPPPEADRGGVWGGLTGEPIGEAYGHGGLGCVGWRPAPADERHGRHSRVVLGAVDVEGAMTRAVARRILGGRTGDIRACHLMAIGAAPEIAGGVVVKLEITAGGRVTAAEVSGLEAVVECIRKTVVGWAFPPTEEATSITATFEVRNGVATKATRSRCR